VGRRPTSDHAADQRQSQENSEKNNEDEAGTCTRTNAKRDPRSVRQESPSREGGDEIASGRK